MLFVILFLVSSVISVLLAPIQSFVEVLRLSLMLMVFPALLLVIFVVFVLANLMLRPELLSDMRPSALLRMVLTLLNRKRINMFERFKIFFKLLFSHFSSGCSICTGFFRHFLQTLFQILKGDVFHKKS